MIERRSEEISNIIGRGIRHNCNLKNKQNNLVKAVNQLCSSAEREFFVYDLLKQNVSEQSKYPSRKNVTISLRPRRGRAVNLTYKSVEQSNTCITAETLGNIRIDLNLTQNETRRLATSIRKTTN